MTTVGLTGLDSKSLTPAAPRMNEGGSDKETSQGMDSLTNVHNDVNRHQSVDK